MSALTTYLEQARIEELAEQYRALGYEVRLGDGSYDLVAERGNERLAFEVKARGLSFDQATAAAEQTAALRAKAAEAGYQFRLVVVAAPHQTTVVIPELEERLRLALEDGSLPEITDLGLHSRIDDVEHAEVDSLDLSVQPYLLRASGTVGVIVAYDSEDDDKGRYWSFPFEVEAELDGEFEVQRVISFTLDKATYFGFAEAGL